MCDAIVSSVAAGYRTVRASEITAGAVVVDVYGGEHKVTRVRVLKSGEVTITRADGWQDRFAGDQLVTIPRA